METEAGAETASDHAAPKPQHDRRMLEALVCPQTGGILAYDADRQELVSKSAGLAYPIRGGIPIMLIDEARKLD
ncbi:Trm112 family protein [Jannaschia sp. LMIT008]|uniref:Trm112 family protein n=1 Tax=Jannaschia maritima TaxID=3032585 RepID=UPI002810B15B|nr:Trm112 family protein [Jannaschia sp. LMIT008]